MASSVGEGGEAIDAGNVHLTFKWKGQVATVSMQPDDSIADLKDRLCEEWGVLPKRQKLIGIKPSADETLLTDTKHKRGATLMMLVSRPVVCGCGEAATCGLFLRASALGMWHAAGTLQESQALTHTTSRPSTFSWFAGCSGRGAGEGVGGATLHGRALWFKHVA